MDHVHQHDHSNSNLDDAPAQQHLSSDHNSDLPLSKCQLVYNIMTQISVHVAQLISDAIHQFIGIAPSRHLVDPEKSNRALGFLPLITSLCQFCGVPIVLTKLIWPPINKTFIEKYCMSRQVQQSGQDHQQQSAADTPPLSPHQPLSLESISAHMLRMELQMHAYMQYLADQQAANHRGQMQLNDSFYQYTLHQHRQDPNPYSWPTPQLFRATVAWAGDRPNFQEEAGPPDAQGATQGDEGEAKDDGDVGDLLDFLIGGD